MFILYFLLAYNIVKTLSQCEPFGVILSLGDYYNLNPTNYNSEDTEKNNNELLKITFQTAVYCNQTSVSILIDSSTSTVQNLELDIPIKVFQSASGEESQTSFIYKYYVTKDNGLDFNKKYFYYVTGDYDDLNTTKTFQLRIPKRDLAPEDDDSNIIFVGQMSLINSDSTINKIQKLMETTKIDAIILLGNMANKLSSNNGQNGKDFIKKMQKIAAAIPLVTTPGVWESSDNFEYYNAFFENPNYDIYQDSFSSFNIGYVHFVHINMHKYFFGNDKQSKELIYFLEEDLKLAAKKRDNRMIRPWIIVYGHYSFYCSIIENPWCGVYAGDTSSKIGSLIYKLEELFKNYQVDFYFSAGVPVYERIKPILHSKIQEYSSLIAPDIDFNSILNPRAILQIIEGNGGSPIVLDDFDKKSNTFRANEDFGFGVLKVTDEEKLKYTHYGSNTDYVDYFELINEIPKWFPVWTLKEKTEFLVSAIIFCLAGLIFLWIFAVKIDKNF